MMTKDKFIEILKSGKRVQDGSFIYYEFEKKYYFCCWNGTCFKGYDTPEELYDSICNPEMLVEEP